MTGVADLSRSGRVWLFGDGVNTDDLYPAFAGKLPLSEASRFVFHASRPGWTEQVIPGDIVIGGRGFGMGSSRPAPVLLKSLGVSCLLAEQFNSLFFRNCVNYGLPALNAPGVLNLFREGDQAEVDSSTGSVTNLTTGRSMTADVLPGFLLDILRAGGLEAMLKQRGLIIPANTA